LALVGMLPFAAAAANLWPVPGGAETPLLFRVGTGGVGGTYFAIGTLLSTALSGAIPGLVVVAETSNGSVSNVAMIEAGANEAGFVQTDIAHWAYTGSDIYAGKAPAQNLRAMANLYPESVHIVVRKDSGIESVRGLRGRRVSFDEPGSGTLVEARLVLGTYGITETNTEPQYVKPTISLERLAENKVDAIFFVGGTPSTWFSEFASKHSIMLLPVDGPEAERAVKKYAFLSRGRIEAGTYSGVAQDVPTLDVGAQLLVAAKLPNELIYQITQKLWQPETLAILAKGHPQGQHIQLNNALDGVAIPLHPGAERYYRSIGLLNTP
jgi:TRAP transporter TAXI family solute receptor